MARTPRTPRVPRVPRTPLHLAIKQAREQANLSIANLAAEASMAASLLRSIEEGEAGATAELYDVSVARWPRLRIYSRPLVLQRQPHVFHPAAAGERTRLTPLINSGRTVMKFSMRNRLLLIEFAEIYKNGPYDRDDLTLLLG